MDLNESLDLLVQEARELLADMESALLQLEAGDISADCINAIFRAAHTIKGSAGLFGLEPIVSFTHALESVLVRVRNNELSIDAELTGLLIRCADYSRSQIDALEHGADLAAHDPQLRRDLIAQLQRYLKDDGAARSNAGDSDEQSSGQLRTWKLDLRFAPDVLANGMDPLSFLHYLSNMGEILAMDTRTGALPPLSALEPETCYLEFSLELLTAASAAQLRAVFDFVAEGSRIDIRCISAPAELAFENAAAAPMANATNGEAKASRGNNRDNALLKVEARKLDALIDTVGELVIRCASCQNQSEQLRKAGLLELMEEVGDLVEQIRDRALNLRMVPIGEVFQRFPRVVRDVSRELNKQIDLRISGADTELDKTMVEKLTDPLMHIVRNAMDHGIESVADRIAAGKPEQGVLSLNAFHQSGTVVIEISDDGRGLDTDKILRKAIERDLIPADAKLTEKEIFALIFAPGFSTADTVTDLSGRGVGMDVVRQNIELLRGSVDIRSEHGKGTTIQIQLPLTLAIIDGFEVAVNDAHFVLPLDMVVECLEFDQQHFGNIFNLRGQPLPFMRLAQQFGITSEGNGRECMVVLQCGDHRAGVVVDRFVGEIQAVIKPLGKLLGGMRGFSGSTILGDGSVALLLDVPALLQRATQQASRMDGLQLLTSLAH
jgi:two-component system chemotaxis sensor kinase CheA